MMMMNEARLAADLSRFFLDLRLFCSLNTIPCVLLPLSYLRQSYRLPYSFFLPNPLGAVAMNLGAQSCNFFGAVRCDEFMK